MKKDNKKKEIDPEVLERFMKATRIALQTLNERLSKEPKNEQQNR